MIEVNNVTKKRDIVLDANLIQVGLIVRVVLKVFMGIQEMEVVMHVHALKHERILRKDVLFSETMFDVFVSQGIQGDYVKNVS